MKILLIALVVLLLIWTIGSWISIRNLEEPEYTVLSKNKSYEIRQYDSYIVAETTVAGSYDMGLNQGFQNIADYIFGNNTANTKIAMTTPVQDAKEIKTSEKIAMTVPVLDEKNLKDRKVSFVMPSKYTMETLPKPNTDVVTLREVPAKKKAVLRFGWYANESRVQEKTEKLLQQLQEDGVEVVGGITAAYYNPPLSMPLLLRNEVMVEVR